jgi:hypothetical protein
VPVHEFRAGVGGRILVVDGVSDGALAALDRLARRAPVEYRRVVTYLQRLVDYGPVAYHRPWFKKLEDAEDLHQLSQSRHRFLLMPHPQIERTFLLLSHFTKSSEDTPSHEVRRGLRLRKACLRVLESEESQ